MSVRRDRGRGARRKPEHNGRAELLKRFALFRAARMGGKKARDLRQHRQHRGRRCGTRAHGRPELAKEQDGRRLAGVVGRLPVPSAIGIGGAKGVFHRRAQDRRIDALTALEMQKKMLRGPGDRAGLVGRTGRNGKRRGRNGGHGWRNGCHGRDLGELGRIEPRGALSTAPAQTRPGQTLSLKARSTVEDQHRTECGRRYAHTHTRRSMRPRHHAILYSRDALASHSKQIAMACEGRTEADEVMIAQLVERAQQMMLIAQPAFVFGDDGRAVAVGTDPERIAPIAAAADIDGPCRNAGASLVENPAHPYRLLIFPLR